MTKSTIKRRINALFLLTIFSLETFIPATTYALTSGPTTPEMSAFEPASTANMVDLFSGDFSYNIPLLDVGGYPVNLAYHSGSGPEEEASWVGMGWSLNPGAINRQLRGLPDDFNGDVVTQEDNKKPNITVGGNVNASIKLFGYRLPKIKIGRKKKNLGGNVKVKIGILHNNYTGFKGMIGIGTSFNTSDENSDGATKGIGPTGGTDLSAGLGLNVDNQSGVNPYADFQVNFKTTAKEERKAENSQQEPVKEPKKTTAVSKVINNVIMSDQMLNKMSNLTKMLQGRGGNVSFGASTVDFAGFQPPAQVITPMISKNFTASLALGITLFGGTVAPGIEGTYSKQELKDKVNTAPAYGFMNSDQARSKEEALLDYNMEKESPYFKRLPNLGVTVFTPDLYSVTSNSGSMQFRPYLRGTGIFFQPHKHDVDKSVNIGLEPAFGNLFHLGIPLQLNKTNNISGKWTTKNDYLNLGDFKSTEASNPANQAFYFKRVGEKNKQDANYFAAIGNTSPVAVRLDGSFSAWAFGNGKAANAIRIKNGGDLSSPEARSVRDKANHSIAYLNAAEASMYALEKQIPNYRENTLPTAANAVKNFINRTSNYRKGHHISQYTITQDDGQRMVYGTPVYNAVQQEVSFAIPYNATAMQNSIGVYNAGSDNSINNQNGKDHYYHKSITPAYTTGHLLTGILSPDYVDITSNGITDDDLGTAVKFNYSELSDASGNATLYKWRTPYSNQNGNTNTVNYNSGYRSITDDDKGNYTWGQKELWYMHSIESKTMVAQFYTEDREDGIGVVGENGGKDGSIKMKRLKEIRLYSKADLYANGGNAVPIKTVHLEYYDNYPIMNLMPNNINGRGKLTLKKVWFSYGNNNKGQYNSYNFKYKIPASQDYEDNQSDRWGTYKPKSVNPGGLDNIEFPYSTQNKTDADNFAGNWQMNEIELPSGAIITVQYESDDYSYVQDRRAAQMCLMTGIGSNGANTGFTESDKFYVKLPVGCNDADLRKRYFDALKSLAYKSYVDLDGKGHYEYVSGYADIASFRIFNPGAGGVGDIAEITVGKINGYNPLSKSAWQKLKLDVPRYAYPEYDNLDSENSGFISAIRALGAAFGRFKDLVESFDKRANRKGFGNRIDLTKSWVRLCTPIGINNVTKGKLGGGHRVKEIRITDQWSTMSGVANAEDGSYGQAYDYTTEYSGPAGTEAISSGVASYEPMMGGDENPFHEPINYVDKHLFGQPKYFYLERPMGESYFPGASVGYSKVTVKNLGADGSVGANGKSVSEFYTAKDFPTKVDELPIERKQPKLTFLPRLFGAKLTSGVTVSQGYAVENNDMHGKPKAEAVYGKNDNEISSAKYLYKVDNPAAEKLDLNNNVSVVSKTGVIENNALVGMDIDMFTEMNESMMENMGVAVDPSFGVALYGIIPKFSFRLPLPKPNYEKRLYRGSTTIKVINRYAILEKTVKTVSGSTSTSENMLWDAETGEVLLSKLNNEFNDNTYLFNYPAHWAYDGMGSSFANEGVYLAGFNASAGLITTTYNGLLVPGDELVDINTSNHYWVANPNNNTSLYLIDKDGALKSVTGANLKVMRSGRRNLAAASVGSIATMNNPISGGTINFNQATKILQAKSVNYSQDWPMPVSFNSSPIHYTPDDCAGKSSSMQAANDTLISVEVVKGRPVYKKTVVASKKANTETNNLISCTCTCLKAFFDYLISTNQLFITQSQNKTVGQLVALANTAGYNVGTCDVLERNLNKPFYALTTNPTSTIYSAQVGGCIISIRSSNSSPVTFSSLVSQPCDGTPVVKYQSNTGGNIVKTVNIDCGNKKIMTGNTGYAYSALGDKIEMAHMDPGFGPFPWYYSDSWFKMLHSGPIIPAGATFNSAKLFLYAYPTGFYPPYLTNAHSPMSQISNVSRLSLVFPNTYTPSSCNTSFNTWSHRRFTTLVTQPNQDIAEDLTYGDIINILDDGWMGLEVDPFNPYIGLTERAYYSFCSHLYTDVNKRPRIEINYSFPATIVATLKVDDCVGTICTEPIINPYTTGILGNWRSKKELVYDAKRVNNKGNVADPTGTHLRNSGYFDSFNAYWQKIGNTWVESLGDPKWQWTSAVNKFNRKGQEVENVDPLGRYSAAQHGYLESVPVAVASNAMYREIGYDGFEDYNFNLGIAQGPWDSCAIQDHFNFRQSLGAAASLDNTKSHSGKYSMKLTGNAIIEKPTMLSEPSSIYGIFANQYKITNGYLRFGFTPVPSKKYIISGWIYDGQPRSASITGLTLKISGTTYNVNDNATNPIMYSKIHVVEGWKRFEVVFDMPATGKFKLEMSGSNINVDDLRIHPYESQLKSFAYDASSMRLMADMDENNFATFYEYDDEGTLIRVKKETEKGISTIKETRSSIRRKP